MVTLAVISTYPLVGLGGGWMAKNKIRYLVVGQNKQSVSNMFESDNLLHWSLFGLCQNVTQINWCVSYHNLVLALKRPNHLFWSPSWPGFWPNLSISCYAPPLGYSRVSVHPVAKDENIWDHWAPATRFPRLPKPPQFLLILCWSSPYPHHQHTFFFFSFRFGSLKDLQNP